MVLPVPVGICGRRAHRAGRRGGGVVQQRERCWRRGAAPACLPEEHRPAVDHALTLAAVDLAADQGVRLYAFGNAPTALFRLLERAEAGAPVDFVCAFPVGFVGAAESKRALLASGLPCVVLSGPRGGSNLCAAACNALLRLAGEAPSP